MPEIDPTILAVAFREKSLCCRSSTCVGICPEGAISLNQDDYYPVLDESKCSSCGLCGDVCPGGTVDYKKLNQITFGDDRDPRTFDGRIAQAVVSYAADVPTRSGGAGGGVVTALLSDMLEHGDVDGCVVTRMRKDKPWLGEPFIAHSYDELCSSQGSRYTVIPLNAIFNEIRETPGRYAIAALPCQVQGLRQALEKDEVLKQRITSLIGLFCGGALEPYVVPELLQTKGITPDQISDFEFRGGEWPGKMRAVMADGEIRDLHYSNYKDGAYNYFTGLYMPSRCQVCMDGSCEFSDLSVSDTWTRDEQGNYKFAGHSRILARTERGVEVVQTAIQRESLVAKDVSEDTSYRTHQLQTKRKRLNAPLRAARWQRKGIPVPKCDRPVPPATVNEQVTERAVSGLLWLGKYKAFRYPLIKFLTSGSARPLIDLRMWLKKRKYQKSAQSSI